MPFLLSWEYSPNPGNSLTRLQVFVVSGIKSRYFTYTVPSPARLSDQSWVVSDSERCLKDSVPPGGAQMVAVSTRNWPWWLRPHLLSLDAPLVAVTWQLWWAVTLAIHLSWTRHLVLGAAVWMIYLADRLADVGRAAPGACLSDRHRFSVFHAKRLGRLLAAVGIALIISTPVLLPLPQFIGGLVLLGMTAIYYWGIHHARSFFRPWLPKEAVVGGLFSVGSAFFVCCGNPEKIGRLWLGILLFGMLCFLNCGLISAWEQSPQDLGDPASMLNAFPRLTAFLGGNAFVLFVGVVLLSIYLRSGNLLPIGFSALGLGILDRFRAKISLHILRCSADFVLLMPWLCLGWNHVF